MPSHRILLLALLIGLAGCRNTTADVHDLAKQMEAIRSDPAVDLVPRGTTFQGSSEFLPCSDQDDTDGRIVREFEWTGDISEAFAAIDVELRQMGWTVRQPMARDTPLGVFVQYGKSIDSRPVKLSINAPIDRSSASHPASTGKEPRAIIFVFYIPPPGECPLQS